MQVFGCLENGMRLEGGEETPAAAAGAARGW